MNKYRELVKFALQASSEEETEEAAQLFEKMLKDINQENFSNFEEFSDLAIFLAARDVWPFSEPSSQLFAEYEIGLIEWIWDDPGFLVTLPRFLKNDIHFGCFVLKEDCSNTEFTALFAEVALTEDCNICDSTGEGWISPAAYVAEDFFASIKILEKYFAHFKKMFDTGIDYEKYRAIPVLRSLSGNPNTPKQILEELTMIHESSYGHESRSINGGDEFEEANLDSYIDLKAKATLAGL